MLFRSLIKGLATSPPSACLLTGLSCSHSLQLQQFNYTWVRLIKHGEWCVAPIPEKGSLTLYHCDNRNNRLKWLHKSASAFHPELVSKTCAILYYKVNSYYLLQSPLPQSEALNAISNNRDSVKFHSRV